MQTVNIPLPPVLAATCFLVPHHAEKSIFCHLFTGKNATGFIKVAQKQQELSISKHSLRLPVRRPGSLFTVVFRHSDLFLC